jgi:hypothetical protein
VYKVFKIETKRVVKGGNSMVYYQFVNNVEYNKGPDVFYNLGANNGPSNWYGSDCNKWLSQKRHE